MSGQERNPENQPPGRANWQQLAASPDFKRLLARKKSFLVPALSFFFAYYFALPVLIGFAPRLMSMRILGPVTLAYLFALSQFFVGGTIAWLYMRAASRFDKLVAELLSPREKPKGES